ncbi:MAG: ribonuclease H [Candidatus Rehaiarchaeum fermentans]|nr:ribonuclease HI [Candidatus Rehaiarchaeum fermentans]MCW1297070.1 ribonuclease HI [Candidatus Rehaiarchaeum fermentans]MCW1302440.1 ribonuclease HI [Candidatus Rehaiarchaeum fermentans]
MVIVYTDGACSGNPGKGAFAFAIIENNHVSVEGRSVENTTNNRMELTAVIEAFRYLRKNSLNVDNIDIYTDSKYVYLGISNQRYLIWLNNKKGKNLDLWEEFMKESSDIKFRIFWVKGHSNNTFNNVVDKVARFLASH